MTKVNLSKQDLSKQALKYRNKFIQEHHYDKSEQRQLDEAIVQLNISYKELYFNVRKGERYFFMAVIVCNRAGKQFGKLGTAVAAATMAISALGDSLRRFAKYEEEQYSKEILSRV